MRTRIQMLFLVLLLALVGCQAGAEGDAAITLGEPFTLAPGETAVLSDTAVTVEFNRVTDDSRCPTEVTCAWEGEAWVSATLTGAAGDTETLELNSNATATEQSGVYGDYTLTFVELAPYPETPDPIPADEYRATFLLERP